MAIRSNTDYIPTEAELIRQREEQKAFWKNNSFVGNVYTISFVLDGNTMTQDVTAQTEQDAVDIFKEDFGKVGFYPFDVKVIAVKN